MCSISNVLLSHMNTYFVWSGWFKCSVNARTKSFFSSNSLILTPQRSFLNLDFSASSITSSMS